MTLATLTELKGRLEITDATDDTALTQHMQRIEDRMAAHCGRAWALDDYSETFTGPLGWLLLQAWPVVRVESVVMNGEELNVEAGGYYSCRADRGRIRYLGVDGLWPAGAEITVRYRGGFAEAGTTPDTGETLPPAALTAALITQAEWEWRNKNVLGLKSASQSGVSVAAADYTWLPVVLDAMGPYRRFG